MRTQYGFKEPTVIRYTQMQEFVRDHEILELGRPISQVIRERDDPIARA